MNLNEFDNMCNKLKTKKLYLKKSGIRGLKLKTKPCSFKNMFVVLNPQLFVQQTKETTKFLITTEKLRMHPRMHQTEAKIMKTKYQSYKRN